MAKLTDNEVRAEIDYHRSCEQAIDQLLKANIAAGGWRANPKGRYYQRLMGKLAGHRGRRLKLQHELIDPFIGLRGSR